MKAFDQHLNSTTDERVLFEGMRVPYGSIRAIQEFEIQRSCDQPLLQAADLLAGSVNLLATALGQGRELHQQEVELGGMVLPALLGDDPSVATAICSDRMLKLFLCTILKAYPKSKPPVVSEAVEEGPFRFLSNTPQVGPLAVLPAKPVAALERPVPDVRIEFTLPIFGIARPCPKTGNILRT